tara:strand:+ start:150 stop:509 length:360 start_codon:yes stop_codon:yes gene_type:complete
MKKSNTLTNVKIREALKRSENIEFELLSGNDYIVDISGMDLAVDDDYIIQIKSGFISKEVLYNTAGTYLEAPDFEFSPLKVEINDVDIWDCKKEFSFELSEAKKAVICNFLRVNKLREL